MLNVQLVTVLEQPGVGEPDRLPGLDTQLENQPVRQVDEILVGHGQPTQDRRLAVIASVRIGTG
jgi:hypothetical protein